jgi:hypothetical protein
MDKNKDTDEFLHLAIERFNEILDKESHIREAAIEDLKFVYNVDNGQWDDQILNERTNDRRPCLTFNKLRKYVAQVSNYEKEQRMVGRVRPVDDKADPETAETYAGMIRQIETVSMADEIYADAGEKAIAGGFGYWRIITKEMDDSFEQEIFIEGIDNQFSVYLDEDREFGFIRKKIRKKEFEKLYPDADPSNFEGGSGEIYEHWYDKDTLYIAEYFYKEPEPRKIALVLNALTGEHEVIELEDWMGPDVLAMQDRQVLREKTVQTKKVKWRKITAHEILEEGEWAGKNIPIIEVVGDKVNVEGKTYKRSLIRDGKDPQAAFNYWLTHITEAVALVPKSPYILSAKEIKGHEKMWNEANIKNFPYLIANTPAGGKKPSREPAPQIQSGSAQLLQIADDNIQDTIGMYEASFGQRSNERTGVAIRERKSGSLFGVFHFHDNFRRAILETTRQLIDLIPKIYDTTKMQRIIGENGQEELVPINAADSVTSEPINDLQTGKYDVVADVRLFATRRQEASENMTELMKSAPNIAPILLPLFMRYQDWPESDEVMALLQKYLPSLMGQESPTPNEEEIP